MKISKLLATRQALLRQTQLANLAFAYSTLQRFASRIETANLRGLVRLRFADPDDNCYWASLTALECNQSVLEEHFGDRDLIELTEALEFTVDGDIDEMEFRLEEIGEEFVVPLRQALEESGVTFDERPQKQNIAADNPEPTARD